MEKSKEILQRLWGFSAFRPMQEAIVDASIYGKDVLALLPTGGGKSICFQVPGIAREGLCIVVSPLIALMEDQVNNLKKRGIRAKALTSGMAYKDIDITLDNARFGGLDFLYVSPERLQTRLFIERAKQMQIGLIVVDEAHCISEWGHDFRPSYQNIHILRELHPEVPIMAVTATATDHVKKDILESLGLRHPEVFEAPFERANLSYEVYPITNKLDAILKWCEKESAKVGIVYCQTRRSVKEMMRFLTANGVKANMYHGGMTSKERTASLNAWMKETTPVMVATNAFGMGIDKPNVRFVIHFEMPNNIEAYFQEAGRAGRDGEDARTFVFFQNGDLEEIEQRVLAQFPTADQVRLVYRALCNYFKIAIGSGKDESYTLHFAEFIKRFNLDIQVVYPAFKLLEMNGALLFSEDGLKGSRIKITIDNAHLYSFQLKNARVDPLITIICRLHQEVFDSFQEIDEELICNRLKITPEELKWQLTYLEEHGIIDITWRSNLPLVTFLQERLPDDYINLSPDVYLFRKNRAIERFQSVKKYVLEPRCRQQYIINYFGQESERCGKCDYCKQQLLMQEHPRLEMEIISLLIHPKTISEVLENFDPAYIAAVKNMLKELLIQERITFSDSKYSLPH